MPRGFLGGTWQTVKLLLETLLFQFKIASRSGSLLTHRAGRRRKLVGERAKAMGYFFRDVREFLAQFFKCAVGLT